MPRLRPLIIPEWIENRIKKGWGSGTGIDYMPWLVIQDFASLGRAHRIRGWKHGRVHHLFSDLERNVFLYYQWPLSVIDIREQFPLLPFEETIEIAKEIGVRHPIDRRTKCPIVMTTDLLLTVQQGLQSIYCPRTVKYMKDVLKPRTREKLEIERRYWLAPHRKLNLKIITEKYVSQAFIKNMLWVHPGLNVLVDEHDAPVLIDYGEVGFAPASFDPVTLELSLLFHPQGQEIRGAWPSERQAREWSDLDKYLVNCPVSEFIRACREWAMAVGAGAREIYCSSTLVQNYALSAQDFQLLHTFNGLSSTAVSGSAGLAKEE